MHRTAEPDETRSLTFRQLIAVALSPDLTADEFWIVIHWLNLRALRDPAVTELRRHGRATTFVQDLAEIDAAPESERPTRAAVKLVLTLVSDWLSEPED